MILVLAHHYDHPAKEFVERLRPHDARLLTCRDLSTAGWRYYPGRPYDTRAVVGGQVVPIEKIDGILTRLPSVSESDLPHIVAADRSYVAAEMTAFLTAWLSEAPFPVVNRPSPTCLMGCNWRPEQWTHAAARLGLRTREKRHIVARQKKATEDVTKAAPQETPEIPTTPTTVTVVGDRCIGDVDAELAAQAVCLARSASVELLSVQFDGASADAAFVGAYLGAELSQAAVADALLDCFLNNAVLTN
ncbi:MAG TPA: hypothetical protein VF666_11140 [Pyrinomonadaceae bacterium]|jgi:hypothetical protein